MGESSEGVPQRWRILRDPPGSGARNMAVDEALALERPAGEGTLRIYRWARPTLSFGRNQPARGRYDPRAVEAFGGEVVRRPTGGREVLHDRELTYSVVLPARAFGGVRDVYRELNQALLAALRSLGVAAELSPARGRALPPDAGACFAAPAEGEVEVGGRKLLGSAQRRFGSTLLQHGSLLLGPPTLRLAALVAPPAADGADGLNGRSRAGEETHIEEGVTLSEVLHEEVGFTRVAAAVEAAMAGSLGGRWARDELRENERRVAGSLLARYQSRTWTWRR